MAINVNKQSGSAIIITMLFGTVAVGLTLFLATLSLSDFNQISSLEESGTAAYANEAATEFLLGAYTYDRSIALACTDPAGTRRPSKDIYLDPSNNTLKDSENGATLFSCNSITQPQPNSPIINTNIKAYYFKKGPQNFTFSRNQARDFAVPQTGDSGSIYTVSNVSFSDPKPPDPKLALEVTYIGVNGDQMDKRVYQGDTSVFNSINHITDAKFMRIRAFFHGASGFDDTVGFGADSSVSFDISFYINTGNLSYFDSGTTTIETNTEYGSTKRKYITSIDRQSGTVVNQGDFVIYGNNELIVN